MIVRLPKWLAAETFTISHDRKAPGKFEVTLYSEMAEGDRRFSGYGASVALAAKRALVARASSPPLGRARPVASLPASNREAIS